MKRSDKERSELSEGDGREDNTIFISFTEYGETIRVAINPNGSEMVNVILQEGGKWECPDGGRMDCFFTAKTMRQIARWILEKTQDDKEDTE